MEIELQRLIDTLPAMAWTALPDGQADHFNQRWCDYSGVSLGKAIGFGWHAAIHPDDLGRVLEHRRVTLLSGRPGATEGRMKRHDGRYRQFLFSVAPITDKSGLIVKWCSIDTDIEGRRELEEDARAMEYLQSYATLAANETELRQAYRFLAEAQRLSHTGSFMADIAADEHIWSDELYRIFGLDPSVNISVQSVRTMLHPEDLQSFDAGFERSLTQRINFDQIFRIFAPSGDLKYLHAYGYVLEEVKGRPVFIGAIQDVTKSKMDEIVLLEREAELHQAHSQLVAAQRVSAMGSFTSDIVADEHDWSEEFYRICCFDIGSKVTLKRFREIVHPEDLPTFDIVVEHARNGHDADFVFRIIAKGNVKYLHAVCHRRELVEGRPIFVGAVQDVTASRLAEEALNQAHAQLAHMARVTALSTLTASIAHEVNQPLAGIMNNAGACLRMLAMTPPDLNGARATAERTIRDANRASEIIVRLRALFTRKQSSKGPVNLNDATREVLALLAGEMKRRRVVVNATFTEGEPTVIGDRVQLQQVVLNLVLNAADAMNHVYDSPRLLRVETAFETSSTVRLSVRDTGEGIDPQNAEKLFGAFYTTKDSGMGIGLSISRSIIEDHGGRIWAIQNDGPGATFSFTLPYSATSTSEVTCLPINAAGRSRREQPPGGV